MQFTLMGMALPFYKIVVNEHDDTGVDFNAFVDAPAHMKRFIAFEKILFVTTLTMKKELLRV